MDNPSSFKAIDILYIIFMIVGGITLLIAWWLYSRRQKLIQMGYKVTGRVVDVVRKSTGETVIDKLYVPVIQFTTYMNEVIIKTYPMGTQSPVFNKGDEVELYYHSENPKRFVLKNDRAMRLLFTVLGIIGSAFFLFGLIGMFLLK